MNNILKSDPHLWVGAAYHKLPVSAFSDFEVFHGHIVWIDPQKDRWIHGSNRTFRQEILRFPLVK